MVRGAAARAAWAAALVAASTAIFAPSAAAQPAPSGATEAPRDAAGAEALFTEGKRLMDAGDFAAACPKFEESLRLDPGVGALLNLAACREKEGKIATAWGHYRDAQAQLERAADTRRAAFASERAKALEPRLPYVVITVASPPEGLVVSRDGVKLSAASLGSRLPVDAGEHRLVAEAPGHLPREATFTVKEREVGQVEIPALDVAPPPPEPPPAMPTAPSTVGDTQRTVGLILGAAGVLGLVAGGVFVGATAAQKSAADDNCPTKTTCTASGFEAIATAKDLALAADITLIGGAALTGAGVVVFFTAPRDEELDPPPSAMWIGPAVSPSNVGLRASGTF